MSLFSVSYRRDGRFIAAVIAHLSDVLSHGRLDGGHRG